MIEPTSSVVPLIVFGFLCLGAIGQAREAEPLFENLPFGVFVEECAIIPADQTSAIGKNLGGKIERLSNSTLRIHGMLIRVNVISAESDADAEAIYRKILGMKTNRALCVRNGRRVVEYPGNQVDSAAAIKASFELGLVPKPKRIRYRVVADIATVEKADYMAANELFNLLISPGFKAGDVETLARIRSLKQGFQFGSHIDLRSVPNEAVSPPNFTPGVAGTPAPSGDGVFRYRLERLKEKADIPFATVDMEVVVSDRAFQPGSREGNPSFLERTERWPVEDPEIAALAKRITAGSRSNSEKADAILEWLAPGKNLKYGGKTGSRWGVEKVLEQKFGHCWDFSDVFVTMARASGVQSRQVAGWFFGSSGHVWAEYLADGKWRQVDPTGAGKLECGIYHIPWFTTGDGEMPILYVSMPKIEIVSAE